MTEIKDLQVRCISTRGHNIKSVEHSKHQAVGLMDGCDYVATTLSQSFQQFDQPIT